MTRPAWPMMIMLIVFTSLFTIKGSATTNSREGEAWLKWGSEGRMTYVQGYLQGMQEGFSSGCHFGVEGNKHGITYEEETKSANACFSHYPITYKDPSAFINQITVFYRQYPTERSTRIADVLKALYKGESLIEFHNEHLKPTKN